MKTTKKLLIALLSVVIIAMLFAFTLSANAQTCSFDIYIDGTRLTSGSNISGVTYNNSTTITLTNSTTLHTIEAIPAGSYGDDDAPVLTINLVGTNKLTASKSYMLDDGSVGCIYVEPRAGGTGAGSKVIIQGTGSLEIADSTINDNLDHNAIKADYVTFQGNANVKINTAVKGIGTTSDATNVVSGISATKTVLLSNNSLVNVNVSNSIYSRAVETNITRISPYATVCGIKTGTSSNVQCSNGGGYLSVSATSGQKKSKAINGCLTITEQKTAVYLKTNAGNKLYDKKSDNSTTVHKLNDFTDSNWNYEACTPGNYAIAKTNTSLNCLTWNDIINGMTFPAIGDTWTDDSAYREQNGKCYAWRKAIQCDIGTGMNMETSPFTVTSCKSIQFQYKVAPEAGYCCYPGYDNLVKANVKSATGFEPNNASNTNDVYPWISYYYYAPTITADNTVKYACPSTNTTLTVEAKSGTYVDTQYQWKMDVCFDGGQDSGGNIPTSLISTAQTKSVKLNITDQQWDNNTDVPNYYAQQVESLLVYCKVSTIAGTVTSAKTTYYPFDTCNVVDVKAVEPTCTAAGSTAGKRCSSHNIVLSSIETVPAKGHTSAAAVEENKVAATCTAAGSYDSVVYCSVCKAEISREAKTIQALGHSYGEEITTAATTKANGKVYKICSRCGDEQILSTIYYPKTVALQYSSYAYSGKAKKPVVTVTDSNGNAILSDNFTVTYANNTDIGKGTATITFSGNYSGSVTKTFKIVPGQVKNLKASPTATTFKLSWSKVTGAKYYKVEWSKDGNTWTKYSVVSTNSVTAKTFKAGTKYQFRVTAYDSSKKYAGTPAVLKTQTLCAAPTIKLTSTKSKTATVTITKVTGAKSYIIYKSTDGKKWTKVTSTTKTSYNLTGLTAGKKIYVKVQAVNAYSLKSAYSSAKYVTVKK